MDFLYKHKKQDDQSSAVDAVDAGAIPDKIELGPSAAKLNAKFQTSWNARATGKISDEDLAKSILAISKQGAEPNKNRSKPS